MLSDDAIATIIYQGNFKIMYISFFFFSDQMNKWMEKVKTCNYVLSICIRYMDVISLALRFSYRLHKQKVA